jgi:hypothetical protein
LLNVWHRWEGHTDFWTPSLKGRPSGVWNIILKWILRKLVIQS